MKNFILIAFLFSLLLLSCSKKPEHNDDSELINSIENNLLPKIVLEGETSSAYNIGDRMKFYNVPGVSIAFMNNGSIEWSKGYGYADKDSGRKVDSSTLFQAASISKPVAALSALYLVEGGKIGLDDNVNRYLSDWKVEENEFTSSEKVTLRRILSHSAGLTVHGFGGYSKADSVPDLIQVLNGSGTANSGRIFPDITPGTIYRYSGGGYTVMQKMLCDITGMEFPELMNKIVLEKLGMKSSTYQQPIPDDFKNRIAFAYYKDGEPVPGNYHIYPEMAAAGLWTTPTDLLKYANEIQLSYKGESNKVLSQEMTKEMLKAQINSHGLGPAIGGEDQNISFSHGGANEGYKCQLFAYTLTGQGVAIMTNGDNGSLLINEILRSFSKVMDWPNFKPTIKSIIPLAKEDLEPFTGRYRFKWDNEFLVMRLSINDGYLDGFQEWDKFSFKIYPEGKDKFFGLHDGVPFSFFRDDKGEVSEIKIYEGPNVYSFSKFEE